MRQHVHTPGGRIGSRAASAPDLYWLRRSEAIFRWFADACVTRGLERVLVCGCESGFGAAILAAAGLDVLAVDTSPAVVSAASRTYRFGRVAFRVADARRVPAPDDAFDAVVADGLVEHLANPQTLLAEIARLTRPGGLAALSTPNRLTASPGRTRPIEADHVWEYTPDELHNLVGRALPGTRVHGVFHGQRLRAVERMLGAPLATTLRRLPPADRTFWLRAALRRVSAGDFVVGPGVVRHALDLVAVAARPA